MWYLLLRRKQDAGSERVEQAMTDAPMPVENDCEDQGVTRIADGCYNWRCVAFDEHGKPVRPQFVRRLVYGTWFWFCPKCGGSYGEGHD